jgi:hypothetical protein
VRVPRRASVVPGVTARILGAMNRLGTALFAAVEAVVAVAVGLGIALVPLTLLWGLEYGLQIPWAVFWRGAVDVWLLGHGVDVTFVLDAATAKATGVAGAGSPIVLTLAALGFACVTVWMGSRAGRRLAETEHRVTGTVVAILGVAVLSTIMATTSITVASRPSLWQSIVLPALWYGVPLLVSGEIARRRRSLEPDPVTERVLDLVDRIPAVWRAVSAAALRAGASAVAAVVAIAGIVVAITVLFSYAEIITLYERSHAGVVGGISLTVGQLAFLPDFVGWAFSYIVGPGFAIGTGSSISPIGTALGPIPGIPVFGALPTAGHSFGLLWVLVPVLAGFGMAAAGRARFTRALGDENRALVRVIAGAGAGVVGGVVAGLVAWVSSGAFGPGRLVDVGPNPWHVGLIAALEVGVPAMVALGVGTAPVQVGSIMSVRERWHEDGVDDDTDRDDTDSDAIADEYARAAAPERPRPVSVAHDTITTDDDGGFLGALDRSGVEITDVVAAEPTAEPAAVREPGLTGGVPIIEPAPRLQSVLQRAGRGLRERVEDARDRAVDVRDRAAGLRERAAGLRDRAADLRERAADSLPGDRPLTPEQAGAADRQPGFPWRTEEYVDESEDADGIPTESIASSVPADVPAKPADSRPHGHDGWDHTEEIPEHELPWWRKPKAED